MYYCLACFHSVLKFFGLIMSVELEPLSKRMKSSNSTVVTCIENPVISCKHFVTRKKRFCKMTVAKGQEFCGEHIPNADESSHESSYISEAKRTKRIPCPLDPKHTVYAWNVKKHLQICNAKVKDLPEYITRGINNGGSVNVPAEFVPSIKLANVASDTMDDLIAKINKLYDDHVAGNINELYLKHPIMDSELTKEEYGAETVKHLVQTSSILGYLNHFKFLQADTSFIEFGAGKGQVSYWLAQIINNLSNTNVILVDKASHRHKQDNKITDRDAVRRIRADIADFVIQKLNDCKQAKHIIGVSKHLCGAATDLAIRCLLQCKQEKGTTNDTQNQNPQTKGFVIALCCHHRCAWTPFTGKKFLIENGINEQEFVIISKMVSWAICGSGMSRETRKAMENRTINGKKLFFTIIQNYLNTFFYLR